MESRTLGRTLKAFGLLQWEHRLNSCGMLEIKHEQWDLIAKSFFSNFEKKPTEKPKMSPIKRMTAVITGTYSIFFLHLQKKNHFFINFSAHKN